MRRSLPLAILLLLSSLCAIAQQSAPPQTGAQMQLTPQEQADAAELSRYVFTMEKLTRLFQASAAIDQAAETDREVKRPMTLSVVLKTNRSPSSQRTPAARLILLRLCRPTVSARTSSS